MKTLDILSFQLAEAALWHKEQVVAAARRDDRQARRMRRARRWHRRLTLMREGIPWMDPMGDMGAVIRRLEAEAVAAGVLEPAKEGDRDALASLRELARSALPV